MMGTRGRKPKPTALKELAGNPGKRPLNEQEPQPGAPDTRVPRGKLPAEGQKLWKTLAPMLADLGVLKETDLPALEMTCLVYAVARAAYQELEVDGQILVTTEGGQGSLKKHPAASVLKEQTMMFKSFLTEFGLTPSSRVRIKADDGPKEKTLADLLFDGIE